MTRLMFLVRQWHFLSLFVRNGSRVLRRKELYLLVMMNQNWVRCAFLDFMCLEIRIFGWM
ncbi:hypothetical protein BKX93_05035 [Chromobacterium vaccinii]|uniref:Uncharacterized protein n=1 Tax=Chromobacterium vaccinii TaxID=1108595 RepID=A0A1D9LDS7_9NEIS|nr:hypothetical protein BKX93_05035 [Chromobacterium vaccinii]